MSQKNSQPVGDPDLQIRGGGGGSHPDPEISGGRSDKIFSALRASFWSKNKGGPRALFPGSATEECPTITTGHCLESHDTVYAFSFIRATNSQSQITLLRSRSLCR